MRNEQEQNRLDKITENSYPNSFKSNTSIKEFSYFFPEEGIFYKTKEQLDESPEEERLFSVAGRIGSIRMMGKMGFIHIHNVFDKLQIFVGKNILGEESFKEVKDYDLGDIIGVKGLISRSNTGELTLRAESVEFISKSIKVINKISDELDSNTDDDIRYRNRHLDLISHGAERFIKRSHIIKSVRDTLNSQDFLEVETPILHDYATGASAEPFETHHNSLGMDLRLRIAPELHLKKLIVGGLEKVFELGRNFRNEGIDISHNPEFTMCEWYEAYKTVDDAIELTKAVVNNACESVGKTPYDFDIVNMVDAVAEITEESIVKDAYDDKNQMLLIAIANKLEHLITDDMGAGKILSILFEELCEVNLHNPTFVTGYPAEISPLARRNNNNPFFVDRFELFIDGMEIANGYSEMNNPIQQKEAFEKQGVVIQSYIDALEAGMPFAAGVGIGIDRLVMLLTDTKNIRDVVLFPQLKEVPNV